MHPTNKNPELIGQYRILRQKYEMTADRAWECAPKVLQFNQLLQDEKVRIRCEPDDCADCWELGDMSPSQQKEYLRQIEVNGIWGFIAEVLWKGEWHHAWDCWGFIGKDFVNSYYEIDAMIECLNLLDQFHQEEADEISQTATYATA